MECLLLKLAKGIFFIFQSFVFSRENYIISSILSVLSCYIPSIELTFHIHGTCTIQSFEHVVLCYLEGFQLSTVVEARTISFSLELLMNLSSFNALEKFQTSLDILYNVLLKMLRIFLNRKFFLLFRKSRGCVHRQER